MNKLPRPGQIKLPKHIRMNRPAFTTMVIPRKRVSAAKAPEISTGPPPTGPTLKKQLG
jgi:hypothetical protein